MNPSRGILRSAGKVGVAVAISRIFGYFRDAVLAAVLGAGFSMDAFTVAFRLANLFRRLVAEGAMNSAFVPVFIQEKLNRSTAELWKFASKVFYTLIVVTAGIVVVEIIFAPALVTVMAPGFSRVAGKMEMTVLLTRIMAPYLTMIAMAALLMGILNSTGHFFIPALNSVFLNVAIILSAFSFARLFHEPAVGVAIGVLAGGVLQWAAQLPLARREGMGLRPAVSFTDPGIRRIASLLTPGVLGIGVVQLNLLVDSLMASFLRQGSVSHIYYADRVMEIVLGVFVVSLTTVILPKMAHSAAGNRLEEVKSTMAFSLKVIGFIAVPAAVGLLVLSGPIIHVLFERGRFTAVDTERTAFALAFFSLGLVFISAHRIVVSAFHSMQDTKTPVKVAVLALVSNLIFNLLLILPLKQGGIALATSLASVLSFFVLWRLFEKRYGAVERKGLLETVRKTLLAAVGMGLGCVATLKGLGFSPARATGFKVFALFTTIGVGIVVYLAIALVLKADGGVILEKISRRGRDKKGE